MFRIIKEVYPVFVVAENVYGLLTIDDGNTIERICSDLEAIGYEKPIIFDCTSDAFNLSTLERHVWIITKATSKRQKRSKKDQDKNNRKLRLLSRSNQGEINRWNIPESRVCNMAKGIPGGLAAIEALGNAIPPIVAFEIFKIINKLNTPCQ